MGVASSSYIVAMNTYYRTMQACSLSSLLSVMCLLVSHSCRLQFKPVSV